jgi:hypothetical protein
MTVQQLIVMKSDDPKKLKWLCDNLHRLNFFDTKLIDGITGLKEHYYRDELHIYKVIYSGYGSKEILVDIIKNPL